MYHQDHVEAGKTCWFRYMQGTGLHLDGKNVSSLLISASFHTFNVPIRVEPFLMKKIYLYVVMHIKWAKAKFKSSLLVRTFIKKSNWKQDAEISRF